MCCITLTSCNFSKTVLIEESCRHKFNPLLDTKTSLFSVPLNGARPSIVWRVMKRVFESSEMCCKKLRLLIIE